MRWQLSKKFKLTLILILVFIVAVFLFVFYIWKMISTPASSSQEARVFVVEEGLSVSGVAKNLKDEGLIRSDLAFRIYVTWRGGATQIQAGEYQLSPSMTPIEIADILIKGRTKQLKITIPEGWDIKEIAQYLENKDICTKEEFIQEASQIDKYRKDFDFLASVKTSNLEGFLFPDTYYLSTQPQASEIVFKMLSNFNKKLTSDIREEIRKKEMTIFDFITLASIIEKEVPQYEDRRIVAGIFYKRLDSGMALESCATVEYILGTNKRILSYQDMKIESPYNTYLYPGLPPGPISNPGLEAVLAALNPKQTDYWYFLSPDSERTIFSRTNEEHEAAKIKYLQGY